MDNFFHRADLLGVTIAGDDLERLLEAIHQREGELMLLRHAIIRRLAHMPSGEVSKEGEP